MATKPKFHDPRNDIMNVFDAEGVAHQMTLTNAREMVRFSGWTLDAIEAATRRGVDAAATVIETPVVPTAPVWEDLSTVSKIALVAAHAALKIESKIDGRTSEKRIVTIIETELDKRLAQSGDFDGADPVADGDSAEVIAAKQAGAVARRHRAFVAAAKAVDLEVGESLVAFLTSFTPAPVVETPATDTVEQKTE